MSDDKPIPIESMIEQFGLHLHHVHISGSKHTERDCPMWQDVKAKLLEMQSEIERGKPRLLALEEAAEIADLHWPDNPGHTCGEVGCAVSIMSFDEWWDAMPESGRNAMAALGENARHSIRESARLGYEAAARFADAQKIPAAFACIECESATAVCNNDGDCADCGGGDIIGLYGEPAERERQLRAIVVIVKRRERAAVDVEREACAKACEIFGAMSQTAKDDRLTTGSVEWAARGIRARSDHDRL